MVDVEQLVDDLRERVERKRAAGRYDDDVASFKLEPVDGGRLRSGATSPTPPRLTSRRRVVYRPEVGYSSRPIVGPILTAVKRLLYRFFFYPLDDLARQTNDAVQQLYASGRRAEQALAVETAARDASHQALVERIDTLVNQLELADRMIAQPGEAREAVAKDVQSLAERLAELEATQERLQLQSRLARLERLSRTAPQPSPPPAQVRPRPTSQPAEPPSFDYMTLRESLSSGADRP